ncbi:YciI family protein [Pseudoroseomonas globiformis]|uniref:YciI family protein n=1 Tax=Teichococcus globiformis TaxID=2307229 RepID=A0ABV7G525_9PROT
MAFIVIAHDGRDAEALQRRLDARPEHLRRVEPLAATGELVIGGAILDAPEGRMVGSALVVDLPDETAVRHWLAEDPYMKQGVWRDLTILPFRVAPLPYRALPSGGN